MPSPRLYDDLAAWWPLLSPPDDYADEAVEYLRLLRQGGGCEVLELGSGGGNNALHLKRALRMTLADVAEPMLAVSRMLNPECDHVEGDMRTLRLPRAFDAVFVHDAIMYMATRDDLHRALATAFAHCRPGGVALIAPDCMRETFTPTTDAGGGDGAGRALRYLEWTYDPDPRDTSFVTEYAFLLHEDGHDPAVVHECHTLGLFARDEWLALLREVGFAPSLAKVQAGGPREVFVARRPDSARA